MAGLERAWLGSVPPLRHERHYGDRVMRCFSERPGNAFDLLSAAAARNPGGEAIVCGEERLSYAQFSATVEQCAAGLAAAGIGRGDRVAMLLGNGIPFPVVLFATLRLGAIAVPLSTREQAGGLAYMLAHAGAKLLVYDADLADRLPAPAATPHLAHRVAVEASASTRSLPLLAAASGAAPSRGRGRGHRHHPLHVRHHRSPQGRHADPPWHSVTPPCTTRPAWASTPATGRWRRCR